jgi:m7GpppX diphosphatase
MAGDDGDDADASGGDGGAGPPRRPPDADVDVLYPGWMDTASEDERVVLLRKHISRSRKQRALVVRETPEMYERAHAAYSAAVPASALAWVYKILNLEKETERLLTMTEHFLMNTDPKWTTHPDCASTDRASWYKHPSTRDLYCLGLCIRRDVRSLRDLRAEHVTMLEDMLRTGRETIERVYGLTPEECRVYVHYPPQFYHFHVHYQALSALEVGCQTERAVLLEDVIDNIRRDSFHYRDAALSCRIGDGDALYRLYHAEPNQTNT